MIKINLLPPQYKTEIEGRKYKFPIFALLFLSLAILILSIGIILIAQNLQKNTLFAFENQNIAYENYLDTDGNKLIEDDIKEIESLSGIVSQVLDNRYEWLDILLEINEKLVPGITIRSMSVEKSENKIEMAGFAAGRQDLLNFEQQLEDSDYFENIILPSSNLISPINISFKLSFNVSEEKL